VCERESEREKEIEHSTAGVKARKRI